MSSLLTKISKHLYSVLCLLTFIAFLSFMGTTPARAANLSGDILKQPATEIKVSLGNAAGELKFEPNHLELQAGK